MNKYYKEFIDFFIKHNLYDKDIFNYIRHNSILFDYIDDDQRPFIGCYPVFTKNNILTQIKIYVPIINSKKTILINIHEYIHAIILYKYFNKKYKKEKDFETLPMLYETIYALENHNEEFENFIKELDTRINEESPQTYKIALAPKKDLLEYHKKKNPTFKQLQKKSKKLSRKYASR